jgi:hypothetical protein
MHIFISVLLSDRGNIYYRVFYHAHFCQVVSSLLVEKPERKRMFGRPTGRCDDNIKLDLRKIR